MEIVSQPQARPIRRGYNIDLGLIKVIDVHPKFR